LAPARPETDVVAVIPQLGLGPRKTKTTLAARGRRTVIVIPRRAAGPEKRVLDACGARAERNAEPGTTVIAPAARAADPPPARGEAGAVVPG
jgi:hypothetical protein